MKTPNEVTTMTMDADFLREYSEEAAIRKYTKETAGNGISYLLDHDYAEIYLDALAKAGVTAARPQGARLLEFGCGGGMNLVHLVSLLERKGMSIDCAYGTDFSEKLIEAANREAGEYLSGSGKEKVRFFIARNETLADDLAAGLDVAPASLFGKFDLIFGVNTFRYCERLKKGVECATAIHNLLAPGGVCVMIDMNHDFPAFRSRVRDRMTKDKEAYYLPTLEEYARPFSTAGFEILRKGNFCWIPHSASRAMTGVLRALTPALNAVVPKRAMRSIVVSRKAAAKATR